MPWYAEVHTVTMIALICASSKLILAKLIAFWVDHVLQLALELELEVTFCLFGSGQSHVIYTSFIA